MGKDITYCSYQICPNTKCERNVANFDWASKDEVSTPRSFAAFTECEYFRVSEAYLTADENLTCEFSSGGNISISSKCIRCDSGCSEHKENENETDN